jgi:hypothetical protein
MTAFYMREAPGPEGLSALLYPSSIEEGGRQLAVGRVGVNQKLACERPGAAWLAAGDTLALSHKGAERQRIGEVAAHPALVVAKGRDWLDDTGQLTLRPLPNEGGAVAKLSQCYLQSVQRNGPVGAVEPGAELGEGGGLLGAQGAFGVYEHRAV